MIKYKFVINLLIIFLLISCANRISTYTDLYNSFKVYSNKYQDTSFVRSEFMDFSSRNTPLEISIAYIIKSENKDYDNCYSIIFKKPFGSILHFYDAIDINHNIYKMQSLNNGNMVAARIIFDKNLFDNFLINGFSAQINFYEHTSYAGYRDNSMEIFIKPEIFRQLNNYLVNNHIY